MTYEKTTWVDGDIITAEKLNHIEDGIANSGSESGGASLPKVNSNDNNKVLKVVDGAWNISEEKLPYTFSMVTEVINPFTGGEISLYKSKDITLQDDYYIITFYYDSYDTVQDLGKTYTSSDTLGFRFSPSYYDSDSDSISSLFTLSFTKISGTQMVWGTEEEDEFINLDYINNQYAISFRIKKNRIPTNFDINSDIGSYKLWRLCAKYTLNEAFINSIPTQVMVINLTYNGTHSGTGITGTIDKTFEEINIACQQGILPVVIAHRTDYSSFREVLFLHSVDYSSITFAYNDFFVSDQGEVSLNDYTCTINNSNEVTVDQKNILIKEGTN